MRLCQALISAMRNYPAGEDEVECRVAVGAGVCTALDKVIPEDLSGPCQRWDWSEGAAIWLPGGQVSHQRRWHVRRSWGRAIGA